jgi:hypothetical protein
LSTKDKGEWIPVTSIVDGKNSRLAARDASLLDVSKRIRTASGLGDVGTFGGFSGGSGLPSVLAAGSPLSTFQYTLSRTDRLSMYRHFSKNNAFVGRALELHSELPMSRLTIGPPKGPSPQQNREINRIYESMGERIDILNLLLEFSREYWLCCHPSSRVTVPGGTARRIDSFSPGDEVISAEGNIRKVIRVISSDFNGDLYVIKAKGLSSPMRVTGNHPIKTTKGFIKAEELRAGDIIVNTPFKEEVPNSYNEDKAELLGWFVNVGRLKNPNPNSTYEGGLSLKIPTSDLITSSDVERVVSLLEKEFSVKPEVKNLLNVFEIIVNSGPVYQFFKANVVGGGKYFDPSVLAFPRNIQKSLLAGWLTSAKISSKDGIYLAKGSCKNVRDQIYCIAIRLGISPECFCECEEFLVDEFEVRDMYSDTNLGYFIRMPSPSEVTSIEVTHEIIQITKEPYVGKVWNLEVEEDHTYVLENGGTHNCGDVYIYHEWEDSIKEWGSVYILPVESCHTILHPFNRKKELIFFAKPLTDSTVFRRMNDRDLYMTGDLDLEKLYEELGEDVPEELNEALAYGEAVPLNTDWRKGSFVAHISRNRSPNEEYGSSIVERCLETLLRMENLKNAQFQISSRNMNPKHLIYAEGIGQEQLDDLRNQVDLSMLENSDYPIVTNYPVNWQTIGANDRLLSVGEEYSMLREDLATGLGTTTEMLTGSASYGGQRITLEMMNTQYLTFRELIRKYVEEMLFRPVAFAKGHYFHEEIPMWLKVEPKDIEAGDELLQEDSGELRRKRIQRNLVWNHSSLRFNRLSIRDNAEVYDQLFQLHQKGSLAVRYLLDLHNIDTEENNLALQEDIGTPRDPVFNDLMRQVYTATDIANNLVNDTNIVDKIVEGLGLEVVERPESPVAGSDGGMGGGMGAPMGGGMGGMGGMAGGPMGDLGGPPGDLGGAPGMGITPGEASTGAPVEPAGAAQETPAPTASRSMISPNKGRIRTSTLLPGKVLDKRITSILIDSVKGGEKRYSKAEKRNLIRTAKRKLKKSND